MSRQNKTLKLVVNEGIITSIYDDALVPLLSMSIKAETQRASHVEPSPEGGWTAEIINGPVLGPFATRSAALEAEVSYLHEHVIN